MTTKEANEKIRSLKALQGKSVGDCVGMPEFMEELKYVVQEQIETREEYRDAYHKMLEGRACPRHVVDRVMEAGLMEPRKVREEYLKILSKKSELPLGQRTYIYQLASLAFRNFIRRFAIVEFPELKEYFDGLGKKYKS